MNRIKKKWLFPLLFVLVLSLGLTACTSGTDNEGDTQTGDPDVQDQVEDEVEDAKDTVEDAAKDAEDSVRDMTYEDIKIRPEETFDKFMELHPETKITKVDLDKELMDYQYVVEGYDNENEYEVKINPVDGQVISDDTEVIDLDDDEMGEITKEHLEKVDSIIDMAKEEDGSDSELDEWSMSVEDGRVVMDVEIGLTEYSYDVDTEELIESDM